MEPQIDGKTLTPDDIGRVVIYTPPHAGARGMRGILSSYRADGAVFVRFHGPSGERCPAERLAWAWGVKVGQFGQMQFALREGDVP